MNSVSERINKTDDGFRLIVRDAKIINRNFSGAERKNKTGTIVNAEGKRNFCVVFTEEEAAALLAEGWNIKHKQDGTPFLQVAVEYKFPEYAPTIYCIDYGKKIDVTEETVDALDDADIAEAEVIIRPYHWKTASGSGVKAYLTTLKVALIEDDFVTRHGAAPAGSDEPLPFE